MPVISSKYRAKFPFVNAHFNTIYAAKLRQVNRPEYSRERIKLEDGDFIDIDWCFSSTSLRSKKVVLLFHGLEGHAKRTYMAGTSSLLNRHGYDCAAVNLRGCSGETNLRLRAYHSGATDDVHDVVEAVDSKKQYESLYLCGFSLGGNLVLKYLGESRDRSARLKAGVAISTPVDLYDSLEALQEPHNWVYRWSFLNGLRKKYKQKLERFPDTLSLEDYKKIRSLRLFDELYTAPANGFKNAMDYYTQSSSKHYLPDIKVPSLLLNAKDDSFLNENCYPVKEAQNHAALFLEMPETGGHVGFMNYQTHTYCEQRTLAFFEEMI